MHMPVYNMWAPDQQLELIFGQCAEQALKHSEAW